MNDTRPLLLEFTAGWCGHCEVFSPVFDDVARELGSRVTTTVERALAAAGW